MGVAMQSLSRREYETAMYIIRGLRVRQISELQGIAYQTARSYVKSLYKKLGVNRNTELMTMWNEFAGLDSHPPEELSPEERDRRRKCYAIYKRALSVKFLIPKPCERCGKPAHGHHANYSKPLEVQWLCARHHSEHHWISRFAHPPARL